MKEGDQARRRGACPVRRGGGWGRDGGERVSRWGEEPVCVCDSLVIRRGGGLW